MEGWIESLINKLPVEYIMVILPLAVIAGIWVFTHIRRDKHGKFYWFSRRYEDAKLIQRQDTVLERMTAIVEGKKTSDKIIAELYGKFTSTAYDIKAIAEKMSALESSDKMQTMELLKHTVFLRGSEEHPMPVDERLYAGLRYIALGGNNKTKEKTLHLISENPEIYKGIVVSHPELVVKTEVV